MNNIVLQSSSFAVIHQINGVLNHIPLVDGRYDSTWADASSCKKYLRQFAVPKVDTIIQQKEQLHKQK